MVWNNNFEEIDTFESFYKNMVIKDNNIVIPYINIGVSSHPLNPTDQHMNINKSYVVLFNACLNKINGKLTSGCQNHNNVGNKIINLGGVDVDQNVHTDLEIFYDSAFLQTLPETQVRKERWVPINTPNFPPNMDLNDVNKFFDHVQMPDNIKKILNI